MKYATLNNGEKIPLVGLGTWQAERGVVKDAVKAALKLGYRHVDCAHVYGNEAEIGQAFRECLEEGVCERGDLFVTSKLFNTSHHPDDVPKALDTTLKNLQLDYLDMYLIHWPVASTTDFPQKGDEFVKPEDLPIEKTWQAMEEHGLKTGKCKGIGVSNFSIKKIEDLLKKCEVPPAVNQVERHPYLSQPDLVKYCNEKKIHVTGYSPLGSMKNPFQRDGVPVLLEDATVKEIADKRGCKPGQVMLRWAIDSGCCSAIPKSVNPGRMEENLQSADVELTADDVARIDELNKHMRYIDGSFWCNVEGSPWTLENLWDE